MCSRMEISVNPSQDAASVHSVFYYPGCQIGGRLFLGGVRLNTLYTAVIRHVALTEIHGVDKELSDTHSSPASSSTVQFMCVTEDQLRRMPSDMHKIALHAIPSDKIRVVYNESGLNQPMKECEIIETFGLKLLEQCPNSFKCTKAKCINFIEVEANSRYFLFLASF